MPEEIKSKHRLEHTVEQKVLADRFEGFHYLAIDRTVGKLQFLGHLFIGHPVFEAHAVDLLPLGP